MTTSRTDTGAFGRYGHLTYTSYDDDAGAAGGWGVKERLHVTDDEVAALTARVSTRLDAGHDLPRFPTPEEVDGFPRRLVYGALDDRAAWWHTAPAGNDASGRPGNVFAHVVLDRTPAASGRTRPINLWRSPDWLCPFGPDAVRSASLTAGNEPAPGATITAQAVIAFLLDLQEYRLGLFGALLDACAAAMAGGPAVVLGAADVEDAALWIAAVSYFMPVRYAREHFYFSTLERVDTLHSFLGEGLHLVCVPRSDLQDWAPTLPLVVLEQGENIDMGNLGGQPHRTRRGYEIAVTEWSAMAQVVLIDSATAGRTLEQLDGWLQDLPDVGSEPAWGLAILVGASSELVADAGSEAAQVISRSSPVRLPAVDHLTEGATGLLEQYVARSPGRAWEALTQAGRADRAEDATSELLFGLYAALAVQDVAWLTQPGGVPLPAGVTLSDAAAAVVVDKATETLRSWAGDPLDVDDETRAVAVAALANVVVRLSLGNDALDDLVATTLEGHFIHRLFGDRAAALVARLGAFDESTQDGFVRPSVENNEALWEPRPTGQRLAREVVLWLYPVLPAPLPLGADLDPATLQLRAELAVHLLAADPRSQPAIQQRPLALWTHLTQGAVPDDLADYFVGPSWKASDLLSIETHFPRRLPLSPCFSSTLKSEAADEHLVQLSRTLLDQRRLEDSDRAARNSVLDLAGLRAAQHEPWYFGSGDTFDDALTQALAGGACAASVGEVPFDAGLREQLRASVVIAGVLDRHRPEAALVKRSLGQQPWRLTGTEVTMIEAALSRHSRLVEVALLAIAGDAQFPVPGLVDSSRGWLARCTEDPDSRPLLRCYLRRRLADFPMYAEGIKRDMPAVVEPLLPRVDAHPDREARAVDRFTTAWLRDLLHSDSVPVRRKARL